MAKKILDSVNYPSDIRNLTKEKLKKLCSEIRTFLVKSVLRTGGHLGSNLGVIELTVALHYVYNTPKDKIIWDVGHQAYPHKILTGRKDRMSSIRQKGGLAPFPKREESEYDVLDVGHSSTSVGVATGMAIAEKNNKKASKIVAVIGDGALGAGMAFEALNHAGDISADILVILNDNKMSISPNVGGMEKYLTRLISSPSYVSLREKGLEILDKLPTIQKFMRRAEKHAKGMITPGTLFEELGFQYFGPIDGHDLETLIDVLINLREMKGPRFLHIITRKGKGYAPAEKDIFSFHAIGPQKSSCQINETNKKATYTDVFSKWVCSKAKTDSKLHVITPAMCSGSGLLKFSQLFPKRYHDVGIAEQHAVTLSAGLALQGKKPVVAIYSSFLQRAYDQVIHDIALQNLDVLFAVDRAGIVGPDGATHAGCFDLSFLRVIPNLIIMAPSDEKECYSMLETGYKYNGPAVVRYPRSGGFFEIDIKNGRQIEIGKSKIIKEGKKIAILAFGTLLETCQKVAEKLDATLIDMRFVKPLDESLLIKLAKTHQCFITIEDNVLAGGAGSAVNEFLASQEIIINIKNIGLPDKFMGHGQRDEILSEAGLCQEGILNSIKSYVSKLNNEITL